MTEGRRVLDLLALITYGDDGYVTSVLQQLLVVNRTDYNNLRLVQPFADLFTSGRRRLNNDSLLLRCILQAVETREAVVLR